MVKIVSYAERKNSLGDPFFALILQGGLEIVRSKETGQRYATAKKASLPCTFDLETCKALVGQELPGSIKKVPCQEYSFTIEETGEIVTRDFRYEYSEESGSLEETVFQKEIMDEIVR